MYQCILMEHWFIDFEFPNELGLPPYRSNGEKKIESELGRIPKGWTITTIEDICDSDKEGFGTQVYKIH